MGSFRHESDGQKAFICTVPREKISAEKLQEFQDSLSSMCLRYGIRLFVPTGNFTLQLVSEDTLGVLASMASNDGE